ncbi:MAG: T9SS type A sorting domain-containing protein [Chitinophagaceae bacterium]|nr:T9SS type A sorting domain-containing protein [Chitinophagaceae bacterium]
MQLSDKNTIVLEQNVPNPFATKTTIAYDVKNADKGQILIYNPAGQLIKTVSINGKGQLNVLGSDLTSGTYSYSLVVNKQIIETRQMVKL